MRIECIAGRCKFSAQSLTTSGLYAQTFGRKATQLLAYMRINFKESPPHNRPPQFKKVRNDHLSNGQSLYRHD